MSGEKPSSDLLIQALAKGDMSILDDIYDTYRNDFLRWAASRYERANRDDILDAWHDTMIMFYEQVRDGKLTHLTCELKTYLFLIGHRRMIKMHKKAEKIDLVEEFPANLEVHESINTFEWDDMQEAYRQVLMGAVAELPEQARLILVQRFIERKSVEEIRLQMRYESTNAVSVTLSRTLKKLKETIENKMKGKT